MAFMVLYTHSYGLDTWLVETEEDALVSICQEILGMIDDDDSSDAHWRVLTLIAEGKHADAIRVWSEIEEESFEIRERVILPIHDAANVRNEAQRRLTARSQEEGEEGEG